MEKVKLCNNQIMLSFLSLICWSHSGILIISIHCFHQSSCLFLRFAVLTSITPLQSRALEQTAVIKKNIKELSTLYIIKSAYFSFLGTIVLFSIPISLSLHLFLLLLHWLASYFSLCLIVITAFIGLNVDDSRSRGRGPREGLGVGKETEETGGRKIMRGRVRMAGERKRFANKFNNQSTEQNDFACFRIAKLPGRE